MKIMVMSHPVNERVIEVFFCEKKGYYTTVDGIKPSTMSTLGFEVKSEVSFNPLDPAPYNIMAKALAEKIRLLKLHIRYKDEAKYLKHFQKIGEGLVKMQSRLEDEIDIPEIVLNLVNTPITC